MKGMMTVLLLSILALPLIADNPTETTKKEHMQLMHRKLQATQAMLEGIAVQDFKKVESNASELRKIMQSPQWQVYKTGPYRLHSEEFGRLVDLIGKSAQKKKTDETTLNYMALTMTCIHCHKYVRDHHEDE